MSSPTSGPVLSVVMYHYILDDRSPPRGKLNGISTERFERQLRRLKQDHDFAGLDAAVEFVRGSYRPARSLCLLTFDDGLKEHGTVAAPILRKERIPGVFFAISGCVERCLAPVHQSHLLMAKMGFEAYERAFRRRLREEAPALEFAAAPAAARLAYRWDPEAVANFKYLLNHQLDASLKARVLDGLLAGEIGGASDLARDFYLTWDELREMQGEGMTIGGHTHAHQALATLTEAQQRDDLAACAATLQRELGDRPGRPFSYPYGGPGSFTSASAALVRTLGFGCAFTTERGANAAGGDVFALRRFDTNDLPAA